MAKTSMSYKNWTDADLERYGKRLATLIPEAWRNLGDSESITETLNRIRTIERAEYTLNILRQEYKKRK